MVYTAIPFGVLSPDDSALREIEDALQLAERSGDDFALACARLTLGFALVHRNTDAERDRGCKLLAEVSDVFLCRGYNLCDLPLVDVYSARERTRRGDPDGAIALSAPPSTTCREGRWLLIHGVVVTGVLVETLLDRGTESDVAEAEAAIKRLAAAPAEGDLVIREIWLLRLRGLLSRAQGDGAAYLDFRIATATWRKRLPSKDIWIGRRRCHDSGFVGVRASRAYSSEALELPRCANTIASKPETATGLDPQSIQYSATARPIAWLSMPVRGVRCPS